MALFDIVIPVGPNDLAVIQDQFSYTNKNIIGFRNVYLIIPDSLKGSMKSEGNVYIIPESVFPFSLDTVASIHGKSSRNGWYLQQLLKLYIWQVVPELMERYLVLDSDTFFLRPTEFVKSNNEGKMECYYNIGKEKHQPYFTHMKKMHPSFEKIVEESGICHHMMFEQKYIKEIIKIVEDCHQKKFYLVFLEQVSDIGGSGASEYELYFNYIIKNHSSEIKIHHLKWGNITVHPNRIDKTKLDLDYVSYHWHSRQ